MYLTASEWQTANITSVIRDDVDALSHILHWRIKDLYTHFGIKTFTRGDGNSDRYGNVEYHRT